MKKFLLIIGLILSFCTCHKPCKESIYTFRISETFSALKDSIRLGDTLWIESSFLKLQQDINTGKEINFSNAENLGTTLVISDISKFRDAVRGAVDSFSFLKKYGNIFAGIDTDTSSTMQLTYDQTDSSYELKVGLVALKAGMYIFTIPDNPSVFRKGKEKCGLGNFQILNKNTNQHLYLFEDKWGQLSEYDSSHSYCIKVY